MLTWHDSWFTVHANVAEKGKKTNLFFNVSGEMGDMDTTAAFIINEVNGWLARRNVVAGYQLLH